VLEHGSRRVIHCNVTAHPTAEWTLQQLREAIAADRRYSHLLHDRDRIFAEHLDESIERLGVDVLKSPPRCPKANAICERVISTIRRKRVKATRRATWGQQRGMSCGLRSGTSSFPS